MGSVLGSRAKLLRGSYVVMSSPDTRLCIACRTRESRRSLLAALRSSREVRVSPALDSIALFNKRVAVQFAREQGMRLDDFGDCVGLRRQQGRQFVRGSRIDIYLGSKLFVSELQRTARILLSAAHTRLPPALPVFGGRRPAAHPPPPPRPPQSAPPPPHGRWIW